MLGEDTRRIEEQAEGSMWIETSPAGLRLGVQVVDSMENGKGHHFSKGKLSSLKYIDDHSSSQKITPRGRPGVVSVALSEPRLQACPGVSRFEIEPQKSLLLASRSAWQNRSS